MDGYLQTEIDGEIKKLTYEIQRCDRKNGVIENLVMMHNHEHILISLGSKVFFRKKMPSIA